MMLVLSLVLVAAVFFGWFYHHQMLLKDRAHLMREAIRNEEFTFRLPVKGLFFGERALQEALNETGKDIGGLLARNEVDSWQRLTRVLTHEIMNATTPIACISQAYLDNPAIAGTVYEEGIRAIRDTSRGLLRLWTVTGNWRNCRNRFLWRSLWLLLWKRFECFTLIWSGISPFLCQLRWLLMRICYAKYCSILSRMLVKQERRLWMYVGKRNYGLVTMAHPFRQMSDERFLSRSLLQKK